MKLLCYIGLLLLWTSNLHSIDEKILIQKIDEQNPSEIIKLFEDSRDLTLKEAEGLLQKVYCHYNQPFENKIFNYEEEVIEFIKNTYLASFAIFGLNLKDRFLRYYATPHSTEIPIDELDYFFERKNVSKIDISRSMVLGGTEILIGTLVSILPCPGAKDIGRILIHDGITRAYSPVKKRGKLVKSIK